MSLSDKIISEEFISKKAVQIFIDDVKADPRRERLSIEEIIDYHAGTKFIGKQKEAI